MANFTDNWTSNPKPYKPPVPVGPGVPVVGYQVTATQGVGLPTLDGLPTPEIMAIWEVAGDTWASAPDGAPLVLMRPFMSEEKDKYRWGRRDYLREPGYDVTDSKIREMAAAQREELEKNFWAGKQLAYGKDAPVVVPEGVVGIRFRGGDWEGVPAGEYHVVDLIAEKIDQEQLAPFTLQIEGGHGTFWIKPEVLGGVDESAAEAAAEAGLNRPVPVATIMAAFQAAPQSWAQYLPQDKLLSNGPELHYVTNEQMGAANVVERMPTDDEVRRAAAARDQRYVDGLQDPGVRLGNDILVNAGHQGIGVEYHEALHWFSHTAVRTVLGWHFNEGTTEYFTRKLLAEPGLANTVRRDQDQYRNQIAGVTGLIEHHIVSEAQLAAAYFSGEVGPLFQQFSVHTEDSLSLQAYAANLGRNSGAAQEVLGNLLG
ncbi:hypothetical protein JIG36_33230 [Actinoplanes sp. LDG1-06]|uniref:Uncharacterized protein n=1 Tax=Paractinoplanes ovalisporus TaxID=2810368 RepID=A0ABS2AKR0_9ACTN|nr:hypothetical protein [Actinoplanes ovalisporus]MBM2620386.1 hypothetical protein [Actinoplanes ovalisporus]